jgi:hypothetical protein
MEWTSEAAEKFKALLGEIPVFMRPMAEQMGRREVVKQAEARGLDTIDLPTLVVALIKATPPNMKEQMKQAMTKHGINLADYSEHL